MWKPNTLLNTIFMLMVVVAVGCRDKATPGRAVPTPNDSGATDGSSQHHIKSVDSESTGRSASERSEFLAIADRIEASENRYLGKGQIDRLEKARDAAGEHVGAAVNVELQLTWNQLRLGNIEQAKQSIDRAFEIVTSTGNAPQASMCKLRALVYLREAEYRNCVERHNCDCCVFPLKDGGVHSIKQPIQNARADLLRLLSMQPKNLEAVWLLNITAQANGDYPEGIPEKFRIPPKVFAAEIADPNVSRFRDVAMEAGVDLLNLCGGAIVEDFNGDGLLDIVTSTYDPRGPLQVCLRQPNTLKFDVRSITSQLGGLNCIAADYDGDGDSDVLVLRGAWLEDDGQIRNSLLQNEGAGNFRDVTRECGLADTARPTQAAVWGDFDNDGDLDLYVGNESRVEFAASQGPQGGEIRRETSTGDYPAEYYRNNGDGTFNEMAGQLGITNDRYCKGVAAGDYDNDGDLDIYVSNRGLNRLYRNDGDRFVDVASELGVTEPSGQSFACWFFDYDNDGWLDLFVAAYQASNADVVASYLGVPNNGSTPRLYRNLGGSQFSDVTKQANLERVLLPMGANFGDIDNDGYLDIYLTTGRPDFATLTPNVMLRNDQGRAFHDVTTATGLGHLQKGHGVAFADIDNDGDQDIYHQLGGFYPGDKFPNALFLNPIRSVSSRKGGPNENHFINLTLRGRTPNCNALGARVRVYVVDELGKERSIHRAVGAVSSFGGSPARLAIGLGTARSIRRVEVDWPCLQGQRQAPQTWTDLQLDSFVELEQQ